MPKLTLSVDAGVVEQAKQYAAENGTSVSQMVETYLSFVVKPKKRERHISPIVQSLVGIAKGADPQDYKDYLVRKYLGEEPKERRRGSR
jgi:hypothetical protein